MKSNVWFFILFVGVAVISIIWNRLFKMLVVYLDKKNKMFEIVHSISKLFQGYAWVKMFKGHWSRKLVDGGIKEA